MGLELEKWGNRTETGSPCSIKPCHEVARRPTAATLGEIALYFPIWHSQTDEKIMSFVKVLRSFVTIIWLPLPLYRIVHIDADNIHVVCNRFGAWYVMLHHLVPKGLKVNTTSCIKLRHTLVKIWIEELVKHVPAGICCLWDWLAKNSAILYPQSSSVSGF